MSIHLGAVFSSAGIPVDWIEQLHETISTRQAKTVLVLTSRLVQPTLAYLIRKNMFFSNVDLHLIIPPNHYLGGNILMGDLMVVEDFIRAVNTFLNQGNPRPDLVIIPSSPFHLSRWGRDLTGHTYKSIKEATGIDVALIECEPIFD